MSQKTIYVSSRTVARKFSIGGFAVLRGGFAFVRGGLDIVKLTKTPLIYSVSGFNVRGLGALFGGISPLYACLTCSSAHASILHPLLAHHHLCYVDAYCVFLFSICSKTSLVCFVLIVFPFFSLIVICQIPLHCVQNHVVLELSVMSVSMSMPHLISTLIGFHIAYTAGVPNLSLNMYLFSISLDEHVPLKFPMPKSLSKIFKFYCILHRTFRILKL